MPTASPSPTNTEALSRARCSLTSLKVIGSVRFIVGVRVRMLFGFLDGGEAAADPPHDILGPFRVHDFRHDPLGVLELPLGAIVVLL